MSETLPPAEDDDRLVKAERLVGRTIAGKYAIQAVVGLGAMGTVYRALQTALDKLVAVKVMHPEYAVDPTFAKRFHREAMAASRLDHPNSLRVLDFGEEDDGLLYIAMDFLDGRDLANVIREDWPLPAERIIGILAQTLSALAVAHDMGVLHRDLKPENIMVMRGTDDEGKAVDLVKVCDFGIAKIVEPENGARESRVKITTGALVIGTPAYMSPEQARSEPLDVRSDLYSMGVILYEMLTSGVPFQAPSPVAVLLKHLSEEPSRPSSVRPYVDARLESICLKALSKAPAARFQNAREMRGALRDSLAKVSVPVPKGAGPKPRPHIDHESATLPDLSPVKQGEVDEADLLAMRGKGRTWKWMAALVLALAAGGGLFARAHSAPLAPESAAPPAAQPLAPATTDPTPAAADPAALANEGNHDKAPLVAPLVGAVPSSSSAQHGKAVPGARDRTGGGHNAPSAGAAEESPPIAVAPSPNVEPPPPVIEKVPPPVVAQSPAAPPAPAPAAAQVETPKPAPAAAPDPSAANVRVGMASGPVGTTATNVMKTVGPLAPKFTACYRDALPGLRGTIEGGGTLHIETDEDGVITDARLDSRWASALGRCVVSAVRGRKIANVDTGAATADVPLVFKLQ